ncbi:hypothetical protein [Spirochaeta africana]|uniref:Uncharacterized protein n=1 Tax=Spirochaeta africana (strain ATCC 700263 / DSM 8902 / Z-7692) TaxID=889378 RepID=H9ULZ1_SPIAZ|nr:hypothetical protein [Spirochaeta africana]AFG38534.1 hypothetical protein Spiaf_2504 [Spirochaeta africana DSM 8902]
MKFGKYVQNSSIWHRVRNLPIIKRLVGNSLTTADIMGLFLQQFNDLSITIESHLRYEKDFSGEASLSQGIRDPYSPAVYARKLLEICDSVTKSAGSNPVDANGQPIDVHWIVLSQILYPASQPIQARLKQDLRNELAAHLLILLWHRSAIPFGRFIRHYYEAVYKSPMEITSQIVPDELIRLFRSVTQIADTIMAEQTDKPGSPAKEADATEKPVSGSQVSSSFILDTVAGKYGLTDHTAAARFASGNFWSKAFLMLWLVLVLTAGILLTFPFLVEIMPSELSAPKLFVMNEAQLQLLLPAVLLLAPIALLQASFLGARRARRRSLVLLLQSLFASRILTAQETHAYFIYQFGQKTARALLKRL